MGERSRFAELTSSLVEAHRSGVPFSVASMAIPETLAESVQVQVDVAQALPAGIAGWKLGFAPVDNVAVAAPLFSHLLLPDGGVYHRGEASFVAVEVEVGFHLRSDLTASNIFTSLGSACVGIEIVRSRFTEAAKAPYPAFLADNIGNGAYVAGPEREDWRDLDLSRLRCRLWSDGKLIHDAIGGHPQVDPLLPIRAYSAKPIDRLGGLRAGHIVTTGSLCGVIAVDRPCSILGELEGFGEVAVEIRD